MNGRPHEGVNGLRELSHRSVEVGLFLCRLACRGFVDRNEFHCILDDLDRRLTRILHDFFRRFGSLIAIMISVPKSAAIDIIESLGGAGEKPN